MPASRNAVVNQPLEWSFVSGKKYSDPFNQVEVDVVFTGEGAPWKVPAFWAGENEWRVRFAPPRAGKYRWRSACTDAGNSDLHGVEGALEAAPYTGGNPLLARGGVRVSKDRRHFEHADGEPFFWLGDTWWMGFTTRLPWPDGFQLLAADRVAKGFSVIQIIAGLYPDMPAFDPRGGNEAGQAWEKDFARVNPAWFDHADLKVQHLVRCGLVPCIVGCWAYFLPWMGVEKVKRHWRNLVARWGAYPVVWCLAGEAGMVYYDLSIGAKADPKKAEECKAMQRSGWTEVARHVRQVDAYHRPITIHPSSRSRDEVEDDSVLDFDMLQTGHGGHDSIPNTVTCVTEEVARTPPMPVVNGECCYEGILEGSREEVQRFAFWACLLSGAAGYTYGANGIWQLNTREKPYGPSPWGGAWGNLPWDDAAKLPGSGQLGLAKRILQRYAWQQFRPHPEWVDKPAGKENVRGFYAAGIPGVVRVMYTPNAIWPWGDPPRIKNIEPGMSYAAKYVDPKTGQEYPLGVWTEKAEGHPLPVSPVMQDWLVVMERK